MKQIKQLCRTEMITKTKLFGFLGLALLAFLVEPPVAKAGIISYTVTDSTIGDGSAAGIISDDGTAIGTWAVSGFSFTRLNLT
ncbi:MAG: hypothetical protein ACO3Z6_14800, partial [Pseudomonadales bacterium]